MIHDFFRTIGFSELRQNRDLYRLLDWVAYNPDEKYVDTDTYGNEFACFSKFVGRNMGIAVCGCYMESDHFRMEYYYPFLHGSNITTTEPVEIQRHASNESFFGICEELKIGIPLIFYINNVMDVFRERRQSGANPLVGHTVISGLALSGKVLLPIMKTRELAAIKQKSSEKRMNLMMQAREGDLSAMDDLTLNDMDLYASVSRRAVREDVLSIVESSIIPYGMESDQYTLIGEIRDFYMAKNMITNENIWILTLLCNDLMLDVCINETDLLGDLKIGRRFKGRIWMQGHLNSC